MDSILSANFSKRPERSPGVVRDQVVKAFFEDCTALSIWSSEAWSIELISSPLIGLIINLPNLGALGRFGSMDPISGLKSGSLGALLGEMINYLIIAFVMFLAIKAYNHFEDMVADEEEVSASESKEVNLLKEIRDGINTLNSK